MANIPRMYSSEEVNSLHLNADKDAGPGALHHTLGQGSSQASPGNHRHDGRDSKRIELKNLEGVSIAYQPSGGTSGTQPTFSGPAISGSYTKWGNMAHFAIDVDFDNITGFGTGQYYLTLPFPSQRNYDFRDGCLHTSPGGTQFHISGHVVAGSNEIFLHSSDKIASGIQDVAFTSTVPVTLTTAGNFHIAGTYQIQQ